MVARPGAARLEGVSDMWIAIIIIVVLLGAALAWLAKRSREADDELADMNKGHTNGPAIFGIFSRDRRRG